MGLQNQTWLSDEHFTVQAIHDTLIQAGKILHRETFWLPLESKEVNAKDINLQDMNIQKEIVEESTFYFYVPSLCKKIPK